MADSDNSTTLPFVTRRHLLTGAVAAAAILPSPSGMAAARAFPNKLPLDPALQLWSEWKAAYRQTAGLCKRQQGLETQLVNTVGFPKAEVYLPEEDVTVSVSWHGDIEDLFGDDPAFADIRAKAEADLAAHQRRWNQADRRLGYSRAKRKELAAADREQALLEKLVSTPATTLAGVAGKLDGVLREGESCDECTEFPWPQIRSVLLDLLRIGEEMHPGSIIPGSDHQRPYPRQRAEDVCMSVMMYQRGDRVTWNVNR